jgi:hypothetical protein
MKSIKLYVSEVYVICLLILGCPVISNGQGIIQMADHREIFVDHYLIDKLNGVSLKLHEPHDEGPVFYFDKPWEGAFSGYMTIIKDGDILRAYYRGTPVAKDGGTNEVTCYAESKDGIHWEKPNLSLHQVNETFDNNVILANVPPFTHNFAPFLDTNPKTPSKEKYKALCGSSKSGLAAWISADGIQWRKKQEKSVMDNGEFDSQNVSFWSEYEQCYVCYFRTWSTGFYKGFRSISKVTSDDYIHWSERKEMAYGNTLQEHLYTNQTSPYFRAPHIYIAIGGRFMPNRQVLTEEQAISLNVQSGYYKDCSDVFFMTSRGGYEYVRTFMEAFIRPGIGLNNWVSRSNYPACNVVQTGENEMSLYINQDYAQPTAHLRRYSMRLDGFSSLSASYSGGEMITKYFTFTGKRLEINYSTSAAGSLKFELQDEHGTPIQGYSLEDADEIIGNEISRVVSWNGKSDVQPLAFRKVRLRVLMKDADLYSIRFGDSK